MEFNNTIIQEINPLEKLLKYINKNTLLQFIIGSSLPIVLITMIYNGTAFRLKNRPNNVSYELIPIIVPLLFGLFSILNFYFINKWGINASLVIGALLGLVFSSIGRFWFELPKKIFGYNNESNEKRVHYYAFFLYALIFRFILTPISQYLTEI